MPATAVAFPTLTQIIGCDTAHLTAAGAHWLNAAHAWEEVFTDVYKRIKSPGGRVWEGQAADAAVDRADRDLVKVRGLTDPLRNTAGIAQRGANELTSTRQRVLDLVNEVRGSGFAVREDLAVTAYVPGRSVEDAMILQQRANKLAAEI